MTSSEGISLQNRYSLCLVLAIMVLAGCEKHVVDPTSSTDSLLVAVLADLYLEEAENQLAVASLPDSSRWGFDPDSLSVSPRRDSILAIHGLSESILQEFMAPYIERPENLQKLYDRVLDRLNLGRQQVQEP